MKMLIAILLLCSVGHAAEPLRWGADLGVPYSFVDPKNPDQVIGFEVDMVTALAKELGRPAVHVQNSWSGLIEGLKRNDYDIAVNGIEITDDRKDEVNFSIPYYATFVQLTVRKDDTVITTLDDCKGRKVATLRGSLAFRILKEHPDIETLSYDAEGHAYDDLVIHRVDAVLLDDPLNTYYAKPNPALKLVGPLMGRMEYGIALKKGNDKLTREVNASLQRLIDNGTLRAIYQRWNIWNPLLAETWHQTAEPPIAPSSYTEFLQSQQTGTTVKDRFQRYVSFLPLLGKGAWMTFELSVISMALAILIGLCAALMRLYGNGFVAWMGMAFVEVFRGTPLLIQLYLIFYGLPMIGLKLAPFTAAILGLGLNYGANEAENYRAGIQAVPKHQTEAAQALGMSLWQTVWYVILPQAFRIMLPPTTNDFIALLKDSSLVSVITMVELTTIYSQLGSTYFDYLGIGLLVAAVYFLIGLPFVRLSRYLEKRLAGERRALLKAK